MFQNIITMPISTTFRIFKCIILPTLSWRLSSLKTLKEKTSHTPSKRCSLMNQMIMVTPPCCCLARQQEEMQGHDNIDDWCVQQNGGVDNKDISPIC
jgi:hypothetical protein